MDDSLTVLILILINIYFIYLLKNKMKLLFKKSLFRGISFGLGIAIIIGMGSLLVWAANNLDYLKSDNHDNKLTAPMRDDLVGRVGEFTMPDFVCGIQHIDGNTNSPRNYYTTKDNCTIWNIVWKLWYWLSSWGNKILEGDGRIWDDLSALNISKHSKNLWKRQFCAITWIWNWNSGEKDTRVATTQICIVYPYNGNWYLYVNEINSRTFCQVACFGGEEMDPKCGVTSSYSKPSSNLCSNGVPSSVSGNGPRSWTCDTVGKSISCGAAKI